ncbi:MAG: metallophosphoesterase [Clostridiales bacterium]|nr:metallophosphoesterase [Clostridiales bacterium]
MVQKAIDIEIKDNYRVVAISDVHGHYNVLENLLEKVNLKDEDYLVIIGDFINKGVDSYNTLEIIKKLSTRKNTIILKGNHEMNIERVMSSGEKFASIEDLLHNEYYETLIHSMMRELNVDFLDFDKIDDLYIFLHNKRKVDIKFISDLPIMASIDDYIFVHGGYDHEFSINEDEKKYLKYDNFNEHGRASEKNVVVGHWPTCNLRKDQLSNIPYINYNKKFIFIDGGIGVHETGEMNAFIIEKKNGRKTYNTIQQNNFSKIKIIKEHTFEKEEILYINYPDYDFEVIEKGDRMSVCLHKTSQMKFTVFNTLLEERNGEISLRINYLNNFLNLKNGDEVDLVQKFEDCVLVKHKDEFGWILREQVI